MLFKKKSPNPKPLTALVCSGGGAIGAYQVGVLKYIHEHYCNGDASPFQIFTGISCGSLNSTFFAHESFQARQSRLWLEKLWLKFHVPEYQQDVLRSLQRSFLRNLKKFKLKWPQALGASLWSLLDPEPMNSIIQEGLIRHHLERAFVEKTTLGVAVAATEIVSCVSCWFLEGPKALEWKRFHSCGIKQRMMPEHVAASCSIPFFMPPVQLEQHYFVDGSVNLQRPFSAALSMGASRILSISTEPEKRPGLPDYHSDFNPKFSTMVRFMRRLFGQDFSYAEAEQIKVLNRFAKKLPPMASWKNLSQKLPLNAIFDEAYDPLHYTPIDLLLIHPSRHPENLFHEFRSTLKEKTRSAHSFMFHRDFIKCLIDFGYEDARKQRERLEVFFKKADS